MQNHFFRASKETVLHSKEKRTISNTISFMYRKKRFWIPKKDTKGGFVSPFGIPTSDTVGVETGRANVGNNI
jgi:hypothetical protein